MNTEAKNWCVSFNLGHSSVAYNVYFFAVAVERSPIVKSRLWADGMPVDLPGEIKEVTANQLHIDQMRQLEKEVEYMR